MKSAKFIALFGALSLMFMGCPYESKWTLDDPAKAKVDKELVGKWDEKSSSSYIWTVKMDDNSQGWYRIEKKSNESGNTDAPTIYKGFLTDLGGALFMNVYEVEEYASEEQKYYIYRLIHAQGSEKVKLKAVTDNITEEFADAAELRAFIKKNMEISFFYNKDDEKTYYKHEEE
jgi:hypothetical protein